MMNKILIIEDEEAIAELEKDYLEISDFEVTIENDGEKGLKTALSEEFDLIILDLMLPGIDGYEICKQIRNQKNIPIIMVSAKKDDIDKIRGLGLGADDYMTKPFSPSELVARVKAHLSRYERLIGSNQKQNDIVECVRGPLTKLADETRFSVHFCILDAGSAICVFKAENGNISIRTTSVGRPLTLHSSAAGKALMAWLPAEQLEQYLSRIDYTPFTDSTITTREGYLENSGKPGSGVSLWTMVRAPKVCWVSVCRCTGEMI